jgi:hypothetical protein
VKPTSARTLIAAAVIAAVVAYAVIRVIYNSIPAVPTLAPVSVFLIGLIELQASFAVRARLDGRPGTKPLAGRGPLWWFTRFPRSERSGSPATTR